MVRMGGAEQIVKNQLELFGQHGHEVKCLCFKYGTADHSDEKYADYTVIENKFPLNRLIFNLLYYYKLRKWIRTYSPDRIIVHNVFSSPLTQYRILKGYKAIQVVHDYYPVCPNTLCVQLNNNNAICEGYHCKKCLKICNFHDSKILLLLKMYLLKLQEPIKKKYISIFVSPSKKLQEYLTEYGYPCICIHNLLSDIPKLKQKRLNTNRRNFVYVGGINGHKGIIEFIQIFNEFSKKYTDIYLDIYGIITETKLRNTFYKLVKDAQGKIYYRGQVSNELVRKKMRDADFLIVPSKWMENYPVTVLEAAVEGLVIIGSDRGGIPEILDDECGLVFEFGNKDDTLKKLELIINMSEEQYLQIRENAYKKVSANNNYTLYYEKMIEVLQEI